MLFNSNENNELSEKDTQTYNRLQKKHMSEFMDSENLARDKSRWLVKYSAEWCGHCVQFQPEWQKLVATYGERLEQKGIKLLEIDYNDLKSIEKKIGSQDVQGFPTIRIVDNKRKVINTYQGNRDVPTLYKYALKNVQTKNNKKNNKQQQSRQQLRQKLQQQSQQQQQTKRRKRQAGGKSSGRSRRQRMTHRQRFLKIAKR